MSGIWLSDTEYVDFAAVRSPDLLHELATRAGALIPQWLGLLPDPDPVLRKSGQDHEALKALAADDKITTCLQTRKLKTLGRDNYGFSPGRLGDARPTPDSQALCDALVRDLERIDLYHLMSEILDAPGYGLTVAELLWRPGNAWMHLADIVPKPREWFGYDLQNRLRLLGESGAYPAADGLHGLLPPFGKFVAARHFPTYENPYGLRLLSRCLFPVAFKRGGVEYMMRFAERWGMPWIVGKGRPNAPGSELYAMRDSLAGMVRDAVAVVNAGADVQLVQATGQAGELHLSIVRHWDESIAQVLVGQTLTSRIGDSGSYAAAKTHADILGDYAQADATLVRIFFEELAWVYGQINAPGVLTPVWAFEDPKNLRELAELGGKLHAQGVRYTPVYFQRRYGLAADEFTVAESDPAPVSAPAFASGPGMGSFAAPSAGTGSANPGKRFTPGQQAIEDLVAEALPQGVTAVDEMVQVILTSIDRATSYEEVQTLLAEALAPATEGGLDQSTFSELARCALFAADMVGQFAGRENVE